MLAKLSSDKHVLISKYSSPSIYTEKTRINNTF